MFCECEAKWHHSQSDETRKKYLIRRLVHGQYDQNFHMLFQGDY